MSDFLYQTLEQAWLGRVTPSDPLRCDFCGEIGLYLESCSGESPDLHYLYKCKFCRNVRWSKEKYFAGYDD